MALIRIIFYLLTATIVVSGCSFIAPDAGFIENPTREYHDERLPFDAVWLKAGHYWSDYKKIYFAPIDTKHLLRNDWWEKLTFDGNVSEEELVKLADFMRKTIISKFKETPSNKLTVIDAPEQDSIILELALVKIVPTKIWLNSVGYILTGQISGGIAAMEGRIRNATSREIIATFKDERRGQMDLISLKDFTWWGHVKDIISVWAEELVQISNNTDETPVSAISPITLKFW